MSAPVIVVSLPPQVHPQAGVPELRFPMLWSQHAYSKGREPVAGWIPDYDAIGDSVTLQDLLGEDRLGGTYLAEYLHSAIHEGGERAGQYEQLQDDESQVLVLDWRIDGSLDQEPSPEDLQTDL